MMPSCDQIGVPIHFHSSTTSGSASLMSLRILLRVSPRLSPSSAILFEMSSDTDWPWLAPGFFMLSPWRRWHTMTPPQAYSRAFIFSSSHTPRTRSRHAFRAASRKPASESMYQRYNILSEADLCAAAHKWCGTARVTPARRPGGAPRSRVGECDGLGKFAREQRGAFRDGFEFVGYAAQVIRREIGHRYVQGVVHADAVPRRR